MPAPRGGVQLGFSLASAATGDPYDRDTDDLEAHTMKVSSSGAEPSALEVCLQEAASDATAETSSPRTHGAAAAREAAAGAVRDPAEGLLELDVWPGPAAEPHRLVSAAAARPAAAGGAAQAWAEHIFQPLL
jgi:type II secretory pathway component PulK